MKRLPFSNLGRRFENVACTQGLHTSCTRTWSWCGGRQQSRKSASFWSPNPARAQNHKPNLGQSRHLFLKLDLGPKAKFTDWVKICATVECQKT